MLGLLLPHPLAASGASPSSPRFQPPAPRVKQPLKKRKRVYVLFQTNTRKNGQPTTCSKCKQNSSPYASKCTRKRTRKQKQKSNKQGHTQAHTQEHTQAKRTRKRRRKRTRKRKRKQRGAGERAIARASARESTHRAHALRVTAKEETSNP